MEQGVVIHFLPHIKKIKNKKIQEEKNDESLEDCLWLVVEDHKMTSGKVRGLKCIRLIKLAAQFWLTKDSTGENIFVWGKGTQIWMGKDKMRILEGLINFIKDLIAMKISFWSQFGC